MSGDVEKYVKECDSCSRYKSGRNPIAPLGELPETSSPFELTSIDICGPYPETKKGNRYLLTFIDHFSRYPEAIPIPRQDASTVARALVTEIFSRLGCPQTISSDKGTRSCGLELPTPPLIVPVKPGNQRATQGPIRETRTDVGNSPQVSKGEVLEDGNGDGRDLSTEPVGTFEDNPSPSTDPTSVCDEVVDETGNKTSTQRYNLRPLPGRNL